MPLGTITLTKNNCVEVMNISQFGFWILLRGQEYFIDFKEYPIFQNASILDIASVETDIAGNLHWKNLDADIEIEALENPEKYPLVDRKSK